MLNAIRDNIRNFLDITVFLTMIAVGMFTILVDYRYFKRMKFKKDAAASLGLGAAFLLLPFALLLIARL
ncbi:MAG TPA: CLC_0170 family protein [Candidatus Nitrosocosmicus sp.]|nr:CLC_0170 family protein [Candidatus Nitrosocosmicus sp.]